MHRIKSRKTKKIFFSHTIFNLLFIIISNLFLTIQGEVCSNGAHKQHKTLCNQYYECVNTKWTLKYCEEGLIYNPSYELCVLPDENWDCTFTVVTTNDSENIGINEKLNDNIEYVKWFKVDPLHQSMEEIDSEIVNKNVNLSDERYGKSKPVNENSNDEDNYESSGSGSVELSMRDKNNVINTQILRLNQLMKDAKTKPKTNMNGFSALDDESDKKNSKNSISKTSFNFEPLNINQNLSNSGDFLKVLLEFSQNLMNKPKRVQSTVLQPIVRPIYINVPYQPSNNQDQNRFNANSFQNTQNQAYNYDNLSNIPLVDSYGYPIASHLTTKNSYYPYSNQQDGTQNQFYYNRQLPTPQRYEFDQSQSVFSKPSIPSNDDFSYPDTSSMESSSSEEIPGGSKRFAYLGGAVFPYDQYKQSILPYLKRSDLSENVELLTCTSSTRQPNKTDCTKYFVCNPQSGVHPFSCPINTAFNSKTKYCDVKTFKECKKKRIKDEAYLSSAQRQKDSSQLHYEMLQALEEIKELRKQTLQMNLRTQSNYQNARPVPIQSLINPNPIQRPYMPLPNNQDQADDLIEDLVEEEPKPVQTFIKPVRKPTKRKRLTCLQPGKVPDPDTNDHYYVCFKTPENLLKLHKLKCPQNFIFCGKSRLCVLPGTCT